MDKFQKEKIKRLSKCVKGNIEKPFLINIRPSYQCNLNCISCVDHPNTKGYAISDEKYLEIINEGTILGAKEWRIDGGAEPLTRKKLCMDIMTKIKQTNGKGFLTTNGTLFREKDIKKLVEIGWDCINISIQGWNNKSDSKLRGSKIAFKKTMESLKLFKYWKKKIRKDLPIIRITPLIHKGNYSKIKKFIKMGKKYKADVTFQAFAVWSGKGKHLKLEQKNIEKLPAYVQKAKKYADKKRVYTDVERLLEQNLLKNTNNMDKVIYEDLDKRANIGKLCYEPWYTILITELGKIGICIGDFNSDVNINDTNLKKIWYGKRFNNIRKRINEGKLEGFCDRCCHPQVMETRKIRKEIRELNEKNV